MKRVLPFIFPVAALLIVAFLAFRWYGQQTNNNGDTSLFGEGVEIEELSESELDRVLKGAGDYESVDLEGAEETPGEVRYEVDQDKVRFSVNANLPQIQSGNYQVWLKAVEGDAVRKAFVLEYMKGGFSGSAAISTETLPFEVVISRELNDDNTMEDVLLKGVVNN